MNKYPTRLEAEELLNWASEQNPGPWVAHSRVTARAAEAIARAAGMDGDKAYVLGLLHDIGRYEGVRDMHHIVAGYDLTMEKGFKRNARICLTHSFPLQLFASYIGSNDCSEEETKLIQNALDTVQYDDYDGLIQLCDGICLPQGITLLQVRLMDVVMRHGMNEFTLKKWGEQFKLKAHFDGLCGGNIYNLFYDEIRDVSFR